MINIIITFFSLKLTRNKILLSLTLGLIISIFFIVRFCQYPLLFHSSFFDFLFLPQFNDDTIYNISISYIAAYIFYIIQVYIPACNNHRKGFEILKPYILKELSLLQKMIFICNHSIKSNEVNYSIDLQNNPLYFKVNSNTGILLYKFTYENSYEKYKEELQSLHNIILSNPNLGLLDSAFINDYSCINIKEFLLFMDTIAFNMKNKQNIDITSASIIENSHTAILSLCNKYNINFELQIDGNISAEERDTYDRQHNISTFKYEESQCVTMLS